MLRLLVLLLISIPLCLSAQVWKTEYPGGGLDKFFFTINEQEDTIKVMGIELLDDDGQIFDVVEYRLNPEGGVLSQQTLVQSTTAAPLLFLEGNGVVLIDLMYDSTEEQGVALYRGHLEDETIVIQDTLFVDATGYLDAWYYNELESGYMVSLDMDDGEEDAITLFLTQEGELSSEYPQAGLPLFTRGMHRLGSNYLFVGDESDFILDSSFVLVESLDASREYAALHSEEDMSYLLTVSGAGVPTFSIIDQAGIIAQEQSYEVSAFSGNIVTPSIARLDDDHMIICLFDFNQGVNVLTVDSRTLELIHVDAVSNSEYAIAYTIQPYRAGYLLTLAYEIGDDAPFIAYYEPLSTSVSEKGKEYKSLLKIQNPIDEQLTYFYDGEVGARLILMSQSGQVSHTTTMERRGVIDLTHLPSGPYVYQLYNDGKLLQSGQVLKR